MNELESRALGRGPRRIWLTLEASEVIEVKRIVLDRDAALAVDFFNRVIVPRVMEAVRRCNMTSILSEYNGFDERLSG
ncbi:MAG: hypothetical protein ACUVSB_13560 [Anaerolineae bacterium]